MGAQLPGDAIDLPDSGPSLVGSLIASANNPPPDIDPKKWYGGVSWVTDECKGGSVLDVCTIGATADSTIADSATIPFENPYEIMVSKRASTFGFQTAEYKQRVTNKMIRNQSRLIEKEFSEGALSRGKSLGNFYLTDAPTDVASILGSGSMYKIKKGFGALEYHTQDRLGGSRCMIHVPSFVLPYLTAIQVIEQQGNLLVTKKGNIVVAGVGYRGADADQTYDATQDTVWLYGTDIVTLFIDDIVVTPEDIRDTVTNQNTTEYRATRIVVQAVNRCVNLNVKIDLANS